MDSVAFGESACLTVYLEQVDFAVLLVRSALTDESGKTSILHLVTSDLTLSSPATVDLYQTRWKVEEYHKSIKSHASFAKSPTRRVRTQSNHYFASLVGFVKLEVYRVGLCLSHFALRGKVYQAAIKQAFVELRHLKETYPNAAIIF